MTAADNSATVPPVAPLPPPWSGDIDTSDAFLEATRELVRVDPKLMLAVCERAEAQALARGDWAGAARAVGRRAGAERALGLSSADASWHQAYALVERSGDMLLRLRMLVSMSGTRAMEGRYAESLALCQQALEDVLALGRVDLLGNLLLNMGATLGEVGEGELALECYEERRRLLPTDGPLGAHEHAVTDGNIAAQWLEMARRHRDGGDESAHDRAVEAALIAASRGCDAALPLGDADAMLAVGSVLVDALLAANRPEEARRRTAAVAMAAGEAAVASASLAGRLALMVAAIDLHEGRDPAAVLRRLRSVEAGGAGEFDAGPLHEQLTALLADAFERVGDAASALQYRKRLATLQARKHGVAARERARVMQQALLALRQESVEFMMHDLRSPLSTAMQLIDATLPGAPPGPWIASLELAAQSVRRAIVSADQTLGILRAEHTPREHLAPVDLTALADDVCEQLAPPPHGVVRLARHLEPHCVVLGDVTLLMRALDNLLNNALRHAPAGSDVVVRVARDADDVVLAVHDDGPGLEPSMRSRLFKRYATGRAAHGNGLGLALVSRVARLHRARVEVETGVGSGTTVSLRFKAFAPADATR